jgi:hypothetical protein
VSGLDAFASPAALLRRAGLVALLHFAWPLLLLYLALEVPFWINVESFQPDFVAWVTAVAAVVALKGLVELAMLRRDARSATPRGGGQDLL